MRRVGLVILIIMAAASSAAGEVAARESQARVYASAVLEGLSPEERVGQLFVVSFEGSTIEPDSVITELIREQHVSGVILQASKDNFGDAPTTLDRARELIDGLQQAEFDGSLQGIVTDPVTGEERRTSYIPLLVGMSQDGGGPPGAEIISGMAILPSEMAIGATWDPALALAVGEVLGSELEGIGVNMLIGPSLDVLEDPRLAGPGDLGVRAFGGDPYWVSELGRAYVEGIHLGGEGRVAVIAKHFPGLGSSDRPLQSEVATVRRSLEQLKQIDLAPFFAVTRAAPGADPAIVDGLLASHIRYQGFQGNIRVTTRPVSLDPQALSELMETEPLRQWRENGGVTVSDILGSRAVRRFYDPSEQVFLAHLVARDAFLAGNDLLLLSDMRSTGDDNEATSVKATLEFFAQKYRDDPVFAQLVDEAVQRILELKIRIYGSPFSRSRVMSRFTRRDDAGRADSITFQVARRAATLISPSPEVLADSLGGPPGSLDRIVFITDVREVRQCSECRARPVIAERSLEYEVLTLYGPGGAGQIVARGLDSHRMAVLAAYLGETPPASSPVSAAEIESIGTAIEGADWLVFSVLKSTEGVFGSDALKLLLERRPDLVSDKHLVVFAHDVPYDLDATDISKMDAFFALYARTIPFVDVAARLLFGELSARGASPVSVPGVGYDLFDMLAPDPGQVIPLTIVGEQEADTPGPTPTGYSVGDVIEVEAGEVRDLNGNPVPDGTRVLFEISYQGDAVPPLVTETATRGGLARTSVTLERLGLLSIRAESDPARSSVVLQLNVQEDIPAFVTRIAPTPIAPLTTPRPAATSTQPAITPTPTEDISGGGLPEDLKSSRVGIADLALAIATVSLGSGGAYLAVIRRRVGGRGNRMRCVLLTVAGGLAGYDYLALGLPGSESLLRGLDGLAGLVVVLVGGGVGLAIGILASEASKRSRRA